LVAEVRAGASLGGAHLAGDLVYPLESKAGQLQSAEKPLELDDLLSMAYRKRLAMIEQPQTDCIIRAEQLVILDF